MSERSARLAERRERLIAQVAAQRATLTQDIEPLRTPLARVDLGLAALRFARRHPVWLVAGVAMVAAVRPRFVGTWLRRAWGAWRMLHGLGGR
jgi:type VI protein secretion system component VasF